MSFQIKPKCLNPRSTLRTLGEQGLGSKATFDGRTISSESVSLGASEALKKPPQTPEEIKRLERYKVTGTFIYSQYKAMVNLGVETSKSRYFHLANIFFSSFIITPLLSGYLTSSVVPAFTTATLTLTSMVALLAVTTAVYCCARGIQICIKGRSLVCADLHEQEMVKSNTIYRTINNAKKILTEHLTEVRNILPLFGDGVALVEDRKVVESTRRKNKNIVYNFLINTKKKLGLGNTQSFREDYLYRKKLIQDEESIAFTIMKRRCDAAKSEQDFDKVNPPLFDKLIPSLIEGNERLKKYGRNLLKYLKFIELKKGVDERVEIYGADLEILRSKR